MSDNLHSFFAFKFLNETCSDGITLLERKSMKKIKLIHAGGDARKGDITNQ